MPTPKPHAPCPCRLPCPWSVNARTDPTSKAQDTISMPRFDINAKTAIHLIARTSPELPYSPLALPIHVSPSAPSLPAIRLARSSLVSLFSRSYSNPTSRVRPTMPTLRVVGNRRISRSTAYPTSPVRWETQSQRLEYADGCLERASRVRDLRSPVAGCCW